jgi:LPS O-antigen subunit length determinant protein (WzzB/FepE family)
MSDESLSHLSKMNVARLDTFTDSLEDTQEASKLLEDMLKANQVAVSQDKLQDESEDNSAMGIQIKTRKLENKKETKTEKAKQVRESVLVRKEDADGLADEFSQRQGNREYRIDPRLLSQLAEDLGIGIHENSHFDEMVSFIRRRLTVDGQSPDVAIVDKAFEFLLETARSHIITATGPAKERLANIYRKLEDAKFKYFENHATEIQVAQNIIGAVDAVVERTGQTVKEALDRYRDVVHNPPDIQTLRKFYQIKGYKAMILELKGLSSYLGGNFKRTNLENPELMQLASAAKKMQAILNIFRLSEDHSRRIVKYLFDYIFAYNKHVA